MTRMIERWFPCKEVSENSGAGWGSGNAEKSLFTWFAARPSAQAKAAVVCSLLPWPDDETEQARLQEVVRRGMTGRYAEWEALRREILIANVGEPSVLDPFSGRGMVPLEAARLGLRAIGVDYSPVAVLASHLLVDYPFRDWSSEPELPYEFDADTLVDSEPRLVRDASVVIAEVGRRYVREMSPFFPEVEGKRPWGYLWAVTLPCQECGHRFPMVGSYELRNATTRKATKSRPAMSDPGQSFFIETDSETGEFSVVIHDGPPRRTPILSNALNANGKKIRGKAAVCPFCRHPHPLATHQRLANEGYGTDALLLAADVNPGAGKMFRLPTADEVVAASAAERVLREQPPFGPLLAAVPDERIPDEIGALIRAQLYGARTYGDLMGHRQSLGFVHLCRAVNEVASELATCGLSPDYVAALSGYCAAVIARKIRRSTRGCTLAVSRDGVSDIFKDQGTIGFSYDFFEAGIADGPGTWSSLAASSLSTLKGLMPTKPGEAASVIHASATQMPVKSASVSVVVTDPPYDSLIYYSDSSDLFYAWLKRALSTALPAFAVTPDSRGLQDKAEEIIVWGHRAADTEHRNRAHYDRLISESFKECRRVMKNDGLVTIVFGHGEPEVWQRLLGSIQNAGLVLTGSWPANTEAGSLQGGMASIETTLTMACRPAPEGRIVGRKGTVESAIKAEVKSRYPDWERWGLAPTDMLMAAAGPAMEVVGRYSEVLDAKGDPVDIATFLPLARAAVQEAMAVEVDHHPLETFDARTRFALWWVRLFGREVAPKSELRWQTLAASLELSDVRDLVPDIDKGCQFVTAGKFKSVITPDSAVIDVALALAVVSDQGREAMGQVLADSGRDPQDAYLWAAVKFLADRLPDSDPDSIAFNRVMRSREGIATAADAIEVAVIASEREQEEQAKQAKLF